MKIHHIALSVENLPETSEFYKENFNFKETQRFERKDLGGKSIFLELNNIKLEIWEFDKQIKNKDDYSNLNILGLKHIALQVNNIQKKYKQLKEKGIEITKPKLGASGKYYCFVEDPNGIPIELYEG